MKAFVFAALLSMSSLHAQAHAGCLAPVAADQAVTDAVNERGGYPVPADACTQLMRNRMALDITTGIDTSGDAGVAWALIKLRDQRLPVYSETYGTATLVTKEKGRADHAAQLLYQTVEMALQSFSYTEAMAEVRAVRAKREVVAK